MPLYDLRCDACQKTRQTYRKIDDRDNLPMCSCGGSFQRLISAPAIHPGFKPYRSPASGKLIESRNQERAELKRTNMILKEPGIEKDAARYKKEAEEKAFKPLSDRVDNTVRELVAAGKVSP